MPHENDPGTAGRIVPAGETCGGGTGTTDARAGAPGIGANASETSGAGSRPSYRTAIDPKPETGIYPAHARTGLSNPDSRGTS